MCAYTYTWLAAQSKRYRWSRAVLPWFVITRALEFLRMSRLELLVSRVDRGEYATTYTKYCHYCVHALRHYQLYPLPLVQGVVQTVLSEYHYLTSEGCSLTTLLRHSIYLTPTVLALIIRTF
jgi:hypothetical protein